jgi:hypothetical protein
MNKRIALIIVAAVLLASGITYYRTHRDPEVVLPIPQTHDNFVQPTPNPLSPTPSLPAELNLKVPFTSQAPHMNWEDPYGELCEEASSLMAAFYLQNKTIANADAADTELLKILDYEMQKFGYYKDTTASETAIILKDYFKLPESQVKLLSNPTVTQIKENLASGKLVLVPAAGRMLPNPNFRSPGPLYHMFVIKGYTRDGQFITNDPGTRKGADFLYYYNDVMDAMHDWNGGNVDQGQKIVIIVG